MADLKTKQWPREKRLTLKWPMLARLMASMLCLTRVALPRPAHAPGAALTAAARLAPVATGVVTVTGNLAGQHLPHLHPAAGPLLTAGPALTPAATEGPPAAAVTAIAHLSVAVSTAPHHVATGPALAPPAAHHPNIDILTADATDPAPGPVAVEACMIGV